MQQPRCFSKATRSRRDPGFSQVQSSVIFAARAARALTTRFGPLSSQKRPVQPFIKTKQAQFCSYKTCGERCKDACKLHLEQSFTSNFSLKLLSLRVYQKQQFLNLNLDHSESRMGAVMRDMSSCVRRGQNFENAGGVSHCGSGRRTGEVVSHGKPSPKFLASISLFPSPPGRFLDWALDLHIHFEIMSRIRQAHAKRLSSSSCFWIMNFSRL